jgi:hypothetical protein
MKNLIIMIIAGILIFSTGCGENSPVYTEQKIDATLQNGWKAYDLQNYTEAEEIFVKLRSSAIISEGKEARVGIAFARLSNFTQNTVELQNDIEYIRTTLEEVFENNINTVYEPVYNSNIDNADARSILALVYLLQGNQTLYEDNVAEAESTGDIDSSTQSMIDRLKGM